MAAARYGVRLPTTARPGCDTEAPCLCSIRARRVPCYVRDMKFVLLLFGSATLISGLGLGLYEWTTNPTITWWMPMSYVAGGIVGCVPWFALAAILGEVEALRSEVKKLSA